MSLPGLQLSAPVETNVAPAVHELQEGSEWRFEVAFGTKAEVKVGKLSLPNHEKMCCALIIAETRSRSSSPEVQNCLAPSSHRSSRIHSRALKQPSTPGMAVASRFSANAKSNTLRKRPP